LDGNRLIAITPRVNPYATKQKGRLRTGGLFDNRGISLSNQSQNRLCCNGFLLPLGAAQVWDGSDIQDMTEDKPAASLSLSLSIFFRFRRNIFPKQNLRKQLPPDPAIYAPGASDDQKICFQALRHLRVDPRQLYAPHHLCDPRLHP